MTLEFVDVDATDGVLHVRLSRSDRLNAVSEELYADLDRALDHADVADVGSVLLSGAGRAFCAGADLKAHAERERTHAERRAYVWAGQRACRRLQLLDKPVVVAVHGYAIGAGAELALSGDVLVMADDAQLRLPEVGLGTFVGGGVSRNLPLLVGTLRAKQLMLLGRPLNGPEAVDWGLAVEAPPAAQLLDRATEFARELAASPQVSMRLAKHGLNRAGSVSLDDALVYEAEALLHCMSTTDWDAGVQRFSATTGGDG